MPVSSISADQPIQISPNSLWLDLCGWKVSAGFPSPAADHTQKRVDLNDHLIRNKEATFLFRVHGDSMTGAGIYEGDTLVVDRSNEAKALGIKMGAPWFEIRHLEEQEGLVALSANFALYGDMSDRMMSLAAGLGHRQEIIVELVQRVLCCQIQKTLNVWINACF